MEAEGRLRRPKGLAIQGSLLYSTAGADRWARYAASQRRHRVLRVGDAEGGAALWRRGDRDIAHQRADPCQRGHHLPPSEPDAFRGFRRDGMARHTGRRTASLLPAQPLRSEGGGGVPRRVVQIRRLRSRARSRWRGTEMTAVRAGLLFAVYLRRVGDGLGAVPTGTCHEMVDEVRSHI